MRKRKYISPESTEVRLQVEHILASSLKIDSSTDVDESDKSTQREWNNEDVWTKMYEFAEN